MHRFTAKRLLEDNVRALMKRAGINQKQLAAQIINPKTHQPFTEAWISNILKGDRGLPLEHLGQIADALGAEVYHLFQPGLFGNNERRSVQRRSGRDRRIAAQQRDVTRLDAAIASAHPRRESLRLTAAEMAFVEEMRRMPSNDLDALFRIVGVARKTRRTDTTRTPHAT